MFRRFQLPDTEPQISEPQKCRWPFVTLEKFVVKSEGTCVGRDPRRGKDSEWEWNILPRDAGGPETRSVL